MSRVGDAGQPDKAGNGAARKRPLSEKIRAAQAHQVSSKNADDEPSLANIRATLLPQPSAAETEQSSVSWKPFGRRERRKNPSETQAEEVFNAPPTPSAV
jgi:hypothetical protein